jgi:NAD(P)-dependent dehydrogenase (short-subunit alcohol dehydrogenase family)
MLKRGESNPNFRGRIINISSISSVVVSPDRADYCVSKAGLSMLTQLWAVRLAAAGIGVYEVRPGIIRTDMTKPVAGKYDRLIDDGLVPEKRWGISEDVAAAVAALADGRITYATGQVLTIDGGLTIPRL